MQLKPSEIRYSQATVKHSFKDGRKIGYTLDEICDGRCLISWIPEISVKQMNGQWVTADNRRLWVFKQVERLCKCTEIPVLVTGYIDPRKLNSLDGGISVRIRGGVPGGSWYLRPTPQSPYLSTSNVNVGQTRYGLQEKRKPVAKIEEPPNRFTRQHPLFPTKFPSANDMLLDIEAPRYGRYGTQINETDQEQRQRLLSVQQTRQPFYQMNPIEANGLNIVDTPLRDFKNLREALTYDERIERERQIDRESLDSRRSVDKYVNSAQKAVKIPALHPISIQAKPERLLVAAIDFGTTFSGYAFSFHNDFKEDPLKIVTHQWGSGSNQNLSLKTSSCILFDPERRFHSFGFDAEDRYAELATDEMHIDWYYFKQYKMLLYENKDLSSRTILNDDNGKPMQALTVFAESIKFLKQHLLDSCTGRCFGLKEDEIHWVLTVPAIWNDSAKQFMRKAATEAGIDSHRLSLALEPEAASMFCNYLPVNKIQGANVDRLSCFKPGTRYMVLDAGGGTADITVHETQRGHTVRELFKANGGAWGGTRVDEAFHKFLAKISSEETLQQFKLTHMEDYLDIMREFENKKSMMAPELDRKVTFKIPVSFLETYACLHHEEFRISKIVGHPLNEKITFTGDKLRVQPEVIQGFFTEACDAIVSHLKGIFRQPEVQNTDTVLMVGGFSESRMLQYAIRRNFPDKQVIIPAEAGLAVLKGAVIFGHNPTVITSRISRFTYGVGTNVPFNPVEHPRQRYIEVEGKAFCANVFDIHVNIGTEVKEGFTFLAKSYLPLYSGCSSLTIDIYTSEREHPSYVDHSGCQKLGRVHADLSNIVLESDKEVEVCMKYGGTELNVEAKVVKTGHKVNAEFEFL